MDAIDLMDAPSIRQVYVTGYDWGSNIAEALSAGWAQRVGRTAMISTLSRPGGLKTPPFEQARRQWYQATDRGAEP